MKNISIYLFGTIFSLVLVNLDAYASMEDDAPEEENPIIRHLKLGKDFRNARNSGDIECARKLAKNALDVLPTSINSPYKTELNQFLADYNALNDE